jgi:hypothetical protein
MWLFPAALPPGIKKAGRHTNRPANVTSIDQNA